MPDDGPTLLDELDARLTGVAPATTEALDRVVCPDHAVDVLEILDEGDDAVGLAAVEAELRTRSADAPTPEAPALSTDLEPEAVQGTLDLLAGTDLVERDGAAYAVADEAAVGEALDELAGVEALDRIDDPGQVRDLLRLGRASADELRESEVSTTDDAERRLHRLRGGGDEPALVERRFDHERDASGTVESTAYWSLTDRGVAVEERLRAAAAALDRAIDRGPEQCDRRPPAEPSRPTTDTGGGR